MMVQLSVAPVGVTFTKGWGMWEGERGLRDCSAYTLARACSAKKLVFPSMQDAGKTGASKTVLHRCRVIGQLPLESGMMIRSILQVAAKLLAQCSSFAAKMLNYLKLFEKVLATSQSFPPHHVFNFDASHNTLAFLKTAKPALPYNSTNPRYSYESTISSFRLIAVLLPIDACFVS